MSSRQRFGTKLNFLRKESGAELYFLLVLCVPFRQAVQVPYSENI